MMDISIEQMRKWLEITNETIQAKQDYLSSLDRAIGDGDHGVNMARGFQEVVQKIGDTEYETVSDLLKDVAMILISKVGGASGPLFGTAFLKMSLSLKRKGVVSGPEFIVALDAGLKGVQKRGKAVLGDKTLVDVWEPVVKMCQHAEQLNGLQIEDTAKKAMEKTEALLALRGRASYLKERSIGHLDPGSVSSYYLFSALATVLMECDQHAG